MKRCVRGGLAGGALLSFIIAGRLQAQSSLNSDLWKVAAGSVAAPPPLVRGPAALLWTPVVTLPDDVTAQLGITSFHAPEEIGVTGGAVSASLRVAGTVVSVAWARLGIDGIARTETSPEAVDGNIPVDAQVMVLGAARRLSPWLTAGAALRAATDRLGGLTATHGGIDAGVLATPAPWLTLGAALVAVDPFDVGGPDGRYHLATEARSGLFRVFAEPGYVRLRYGLSFPDGERASHFFTGGLAIGDALRLDAGAVRESRALTVVWRSRLGVGVRTRHYELQFGRDGGVNGFGATYALGLLVRFP